MFAYLDLPSALILFGCLVVFLCGVLVDAVRQERKADRGAREMAREMRR